MPRYLGLDYVSQALQQKRALLERMTLPLPHHVELYAHNGDPPSSNYVSPWLLEEFQMTFSTQNTHYHYHQQQMFSDSQQQLFGSNTADTIIHDLNLLEGNLALKNNKLEEFQPDKDRESESVGDLSVDLLLSEEVDAAIEGLERDSSTSQNSCCCVVSRAAVCGEEFVKEELHDWELMISSTHSDDLLEDPVSPGHVPIMLGLIPTAHDLTARLKPKLVQDPLSDHRGQPHTYFSVLQSDFLLSLGSVHTTATSSAKSLDYSELFTHEKLSPDNDSSHIEPLMEPTMADSHLTLLPSPVTAAKTLLELSEENTGEMEEFSGLCVSGVTTALCKPEFSSTPVVSIDEQITAQHLNGVQVALSDGNLDDSGIGQMLLESPCILAPPLSPAPLVDQLSCLKLLPISPENDECLLPCAQRGKLLKKLTQNDHTFDTILALILPYPDGDSDTTSVVVVMGNAVEEVMSLLQLKKEKISGNMMFDLPWDPVVYTHAHMTRAQNRVTSLKLEKEERCELMEDTLMEEFCKDDTHIQYWKCDEVYDTVDESSAPAPVYCHQDSYRQERQLVLDHYPPSHQSSRLSARTGATAVAVSSSYDHHGDCFGLDSFLMLRMGRGTRGSAKENSLMSQSQNTELTQDDDVSELDDDDDDLILTDSSKSVTPTIVDIKLTGSYQEFLEHVSTLCGPFLTALKTSSISCRKVTLSSLPLDTLKFFMRQQQKHYEEARTTQQQHDLLQCYQSSVCLYIMGCVVDVLLSCGVSAALATFSDLLGENEELVKDSLDDVKQEFLQVKFQTTHQLNSSLTHPKLQRILLLASQWWNSFRRRGKKKTVKEKAMIVVEREFSALSGEILDVLQSVKDLKSCVFSFVAKDGQEQLYQQVLEDRLNHYDCLVTPRKAIESHMFPWHQISLLIEYEPLTAPLFSPDSLTSAKLKEYYILKTARQVVLSEILAPKQAEGVGHSTLAATGQYVFIASESITANAELLQLLEMRYNIVVIERDYHRIQTSSHHVSKLHYADVIVDSGVGVVVRALQLLSSDAGLKVLVNCLSALSLQYEQCWVILHSTDSKSYHFAGSIPTNLSRLHAALAHHNAKKKKTGYRIKVLCVFSFDELAQILRSIGESRYETADHKAGWMDREWISEEMTPHEKFLISLPCISAFNAQLMLQTHKLSDLLTMDIDDLRITFSSIPDKVLTCFRHLCTLGIDHNNDRVDASSVQSIVDPAQPPEVNTTIELDRLDQPVQPVSIFIDDEGWESNGEDRPPHAFHLFDNPSHEPPESSSYLFDHQLSPAITQTDSDTDAHTNQYQFTEDLYLGQEHETAHFDLYPTLQYFPSEADQQSPSSTTIVSEKYLPSLRNSEQAFLCPPPEQKRQRGLEERRPLKSLDLGFEPIPHPPTPLLTDDRAIAVNYSQSNPSSLTASDRSSHRFSRALASDAQMIPEAPINSSYHFRPTHYTSGFTVARKQRYLHNEVSGRSQQEVPTCQHSPLPSGDVSMYQSPTIRRMVNSRNTKRLSYERDPNRVDGQTRLVVTSNI